MVVVTKVAVQVTLTITAQGAERTGKGLLASVSDDMAFVSLFLAHAREAPLAVGTEHHLQQQHCTQTTTMPILTLIKEHPASSQPFLLLQTSQLVK